MVHVPPGREGRIAKYRTEFISASNARDKMPIGRKLMPAPHTGRHRRACLARLAAAARRHILRMIGDTSAVPRQRSSRDAALFRKTRVGTFRQCAGRGTRLVPVRFPTDSMAICVTYKERTGQLNAMQAHWSVSSGRSLPTVPP